MPLTRNVDLRNLNRVKRPATTTTNLDPITYNDRYPGLDEYNYNKLSSKIDSLGLSGYDREKAMDEAYIQVLPLVQNDIKNSDRRKYINQSKYEVSQIQDPTQQKQANMKLSVVELTQLVKEKYNVDPSANDEAVFNSWMETIPNGEQLLVKYLNNGDKELLYKGGLEKDPNEGKQKLRDNFWDSLWDNIKTKANIPVDNFKKRGKRTFNEASEKIYKNMLKNTLGDSLLGKMGINLDNFVDTVTDKTLSPALQQDTLNYQNQINERYQALEQKNMDQDIKNYYDNKGYTKLLGEGDFKGFLYKSMGDAAQNREMPAVIAASIFQPEVGMALMTTDAYTRENQEAFENMMNNGATYEQAEQGAVAVGLVNAAVEVTLEKLLGGVETSASSAIRKTLMKNVQEEATKKGLGRILLEGVGTQLRASGEEGLEEIIQQIVQNAAVKTVNENQELFEGVGQAFEGGFYNPLNLLAGGGNINQNINQNKDVIREQIMEGAYNAGQTARNITDKVRITKDGNVNTQGAVAVEGAEMVTPQGTETTVDETIDANNPLSVYQQGEITKLNNSIKDANNPMANMDGTFTTEDGDVIELIDEESTTENNTNTDLAKTQGGNKFWEAVSGLEDNIKEKIKRNPYAIEESRELIKNMENNPGLDFTEYQNERYESVLDMIEERLKQAEDKRRNDVGGLYTKLEEANAPIDTTNLKNRVAEYQARVEELGDILSSSDKAKIEAILKNIQEIGDGTMDIWKVRKIADQWAKYDQGATGDGIRLIRDIRNAIDDEIMAQNPEMKEVDQAYRKAKDEIQDLRGNLTYKKTGEIKSNAVSTVKNMLNANNKKYLSTLEKYIPGITERLQAIRDSKLVYNAYTSGEGSRFVSKGRDFVTKGILAGGGYLLGGPVGAGVGYLISGKVDDAITSLARKGLKETITKETAESRAELERINKKIEENQRLEAEEKAKLRELGDRIMQKVATMDKTDAEQSAWESYLADLEQDEVIDMPEEVYDQWEEVTTAPKKKTTKKKTGKMATSKKKS